MLQWCDQSVWDLGMSKKLIFMPSMSLYFNDWKEERLLGLPRSEWEHFLTLSRCVRVSVWRPRFSDAGVRSTSQSVEEIELLPLVTLVILPRWPVEGRNTHHAPLARPDRLWRSVLYLRCLTGKASRHLHLTFQIYGPLPAATVLCLVSADEARLLRLLSVEGESLSIRGSSVDVVDIDFLVIQFKVQCFVVSDSVDSVPESGPIHIFRWSTQSSTANRSRLVGTPICPWT